MISQINRSVCGQVLRVYQRGTCTLLGISSYINAKNVIQTLPDLFSKCFYCIMINVRLWIQQKGVLCLVGNITSNLQYVL